MKEDDKKDKNHGRRKKYNLYKPRKKKSAEEESAIQYLQAQYEKVSWWFTLAKKCNLGVIFQVLPSVL